MNLWYWIVDVAVVNAYACHRFLHDQNAPDNAEHDSDEDEECESRERSHLEFRREIVLALLTKGKPAGKREKKGRGRPSATFGGEGASDSRRRRTGSSGTLVPAGVMVTGQHCGM